MSEHGALEARLGVALRQQDEAQPVDVRAARAELARRRSGSGGWIRPIAVTAAVVVAAVVGVTTGVTWLDRDSAPAPAQRVTLPSGLPAGVLFGEVVHRHESTSAIVAVGLRVGSDGSGSVLVPADGGRYERVHFVGAEPGHVVIYGDSPSCSGRPELLLGFTVSGTTVTITSATAGGCTVTDAAAAELVGALLTRQGAPG